MCLNAIMYNRPGTSYNDDAKVMFEYVEDKLGEMKQLLVHQGFLLPPGPATLDDVRSISEAENDAEEVQFDDTSNKELGAFGNIPAHYPAYNLNVADID